MPQPSTSQEYWLPGYGLSRHIVLGQLQYFLGPSATVRPYSYHVCAGTDAGESGTDRGQGREGYLINGMQLTKVSTSLSSSLSSGPEEFR